MEECRSSAPWMWKPAAFSMLYLISALHWCFLYLYSAFLLSELLNIIEQEGKAKISLANCDKILDNLYLGGVEAVGDHDQLTSQGVRAICVCCREFEIPSKSFVPTIEYYRVDVEDMSKEPLEFFLEEATEPGRSFFLSLSNFSCQFFLNILLFYFTFFALCKGPMDDGNSCTTIAQFWHKSSNRTFSHLFTSIHRYPWFCSGFHSFMALTKRAGSRPLSSWRFQKCIRGIGLHGSLCKFQFERCFCVPPGSQTCRHTKSGFHGETGCLRGHGWKRARHCVSQMYRNVKKVV